MKLSFKKRIAFLNTIAVALTTAIVFMIIYSVVYYTSFRHLDNDILLEKEEILHTLDWKQDSIIINKLPEWEEAEHKKVEVNPTFIQVVDNKDSLIFRSANLRTNHFLFDPLNTKEKFYNTVVENQQLRMGQFPVQNDDGKIIGQLSIGISQQESHNVLNNLLIALCISFPILLLVLYIVIYLTASKAIAPVNQLIKTAAGINDSNINIRLPLPENEDELFQLTKTINELLNRIETSIQQQKQFTADASHEIRTPLAAIRGTLEVLLRKKREPAVYEEKLKEVVNQTSRLNQLLDQLLQLARLENGSVKKDVVYISKLVAETVAKYQKEIAEKGIQLKIAVKETAAVFADQLFLSMITDNLLSNALKYGKATGNIFIVWHEKDRIFSITNEGPVIAPNQLPFLFNRFYRTDESRSSQIAGSGLGLAIVKKLTDLMHITIAVSSDAGSTTFSLQFPQ
jgi:two-component system, OmpR family, heavy metal sensor histidine kinase CusS